MDRQTPPPTAEALRALRERYRATSANTVAAFRRLAAQLARTPSAPELVETLRRELHRVRGTAGTYGFPEASELAGWLEERAIAWVGDPLLDCDQRASMTADFATALEAQLARSPQSGGAAETASDAAPNAEPGRVVPPPSVTPAPAASPRAAGGAPDILIVEDDQAFVEMLEYALGTTEYSFRQYASGPEALDALLALDTTGKRPVILLDIDLPGLDGFSLYERLRVERPNAYAVVFLTARGGEAEQLRAYRAGAIDYIAKPVNLRILMAKIPSWLGRTRHAA